MTLHEKITAAVTLILLLAGGIGFAYHWWVNDWRYWFGGMFAGLSRTLPPLDLPGPVGLTEESPQSRAGEFHDGWERLDPDQAADQLIAEWHSPDLSDPLTSYPGRWDGGDWRDDPDLVVWDAKQQAARCWEIVHVEFPRLRAELCAA